MQKNGNDPGSMIGLLGGTFNPVHIGHLRLAASVADALGLDRIEFVPCAVPPHKPDTDLLSFEMRVSLLQAALENSPNNRTQFAISTLESELEPPSYTWNLVQAWKKLHPDHPPLFILGGEDFAHMDSWYRGEELPLETNLAIVPRGTFTEQDFCSRILSKWPEASISCLNGQEDILQAALPKQDEENAGTYCYFLPLPILDISSSALRQSWLDGRDIRFLMPDASIALLNQYAEEIRACWEKAR